MAITRAQQAKQMLQDGGMLVQPSMTGKRPGYRSEKAQASRQKSMGGPKQSTFDSEVEDQTSSDDRREVQLTGGDQGSGLDRRRKENITKLKTFKDTRPEVKTPPLGVLSFFKKPLQKFSDFTTARNRAFFEDVIRAGKIPGLNFATVSDMTDEELEKEYQDYMSARLSGETDAYGNPNPGFGKDDGPDPIIPLITTTDDTEDNTEDDPTNIFAKAGITPRIAGSLFAADGGRIGLQEGGGIEQRLEQLGGDVSSAEQMLQGINQRLQSAESSLGEGGGTEVIQASGTFNDKPLFPEGTTFPSGGMKLPVFTGTPQQIDPPIFMRPGNIPGTDAPYSSLRGGNQFSQITPPQTPVAMQTPLGGIPAAGYAEGGPIGGIMDIARQEMFLGGIAKGLKKAVKGVSRAVKKVAKSPIGKAAILGAIGYGLGGGTFFGKALPGVGTGGGFSFKNILPNLMGVKETGGVGVGFEGILGKLGLTKGFGSAMPTVTGGITLASILPLLVGKTEEEKKNILDEYYASQQLTPSQSVRGVGSEMDFYNYNLPVTAADGGRIGYQEGSKEPVAKETMPLLDMGGKEMDLREDGGFVPIGRMEKADDVPARLSKNEFVFTADAVRNAGDGNVDKGAEVMYNMMKNLESGGDVSEESQGLEGAREMFQTSKRLEEVL
jgi:hypothetical protein